MVSKVLPTILIGACLLLFSSFRFSDASPLRNQKSIELEAFPLVVPTMVFGLAKERFYQVEQRALDEATSFKTLLKQLKLPKEQRSIILSKVAKRIGTSRNTVEEVGLFYNAERQLEFVAAPINAYSFLRIDLINQKIEIDDLAGIQSEYASTTMFFNGDVDSTLHYTLLDGALKAQIRTTLVKDMPLDTAFHAGVVKLIYTIKRDQSGDVVGYGGVEALRYQINQKERTSIRFVDGDLEVDGFFNPDGSPVQQTWLASPVPGARISSPYNLRRLHPILKRIKPHYGTDYAASYGTPVLAVSDGVVIARRRTRSNGNYIKIRHNDTYQSQYLHLKGFASGIKNGSRVTKGQVIGYVGSTGLADGPHVCFRFWKNDHQIDHRKECLPTSIELTGKSLITFQQKQKEVEQLLQTRA